LEQLAGLPLILPVHTPDLPELLLSQQVRGLFVRLRLECEMAEFTYLSVDEQRSLSAEGSFFFSGLFCLLRAGSEAVHATRFSGGSGARGRFSKSSSDSMATLRPHE
jgi:hypothetical protein